MDGLIKAYQMLQELTPIVKQLDYGAFGSVWAMMLEEWCKEHKEDAVETADDLVMLIHRINDELGAY